MKQGSWCQRDRLAIEKVNPAERFFRIQVLQKSVADIRHEPMRIGSGVFVLFVNGSLSRHKSSA